MRKQSPTFCSSEVAQIHRNSQATSIDMKISENIIKKIILEEQPISLVDILLRRTGLGWGADQGKSTTSEVATLMVELKGWDKQRKEKEIQSFHQHIKEMHQVQ
jgi:glycerol-3-phosphate dehydrogenase